MSKPGKAVFGIQKLNRRYSTPNHLKGAKISVQSMNRTMSLKLKKINEIKSARSHYELQVEQQMNQVVREEESYEPKQFFKTHHRIFRGKSHENKISLQNNNLFIDTKYTKRTKKEDQQVIQKTRPVYFSSNLQQKMNLYLNGLINRSQEQHINQIKDIEIKLSEQPLIRKPSLNLQNLFWRKMKRITSQKKQGLERQQSTQEHSLQKKQNKL